MIYLCVRVTNAHIGKHFYGFDGVHVGYGVSRRNVEGRMLVELCWRKNYVCQIHGFHGVKGR